MSKKLLVILGALGLVVLAGLTYLFLRNAFKQGGIFSSPLPYEWQFAETTDETAPMPRTKISLKLGEQTFELGIFPGSCQEIKPGERGVFGEPSEQNEVTRSQCWFAGSGTEVGIFLENNRFFVKSGELVEGNAEEPSFRGNFQNILEI